MNNYFRFLESQMAAVAHLEGNLRFSSFEHFRQIQDRNRQDRSEGAASYKIKDGLHVQVVNDQFPTQSIYILSFTEHAAIQGFGEYRFTLLDHNSLVERVKAALPRDASVLFAKVAYGKPAEFDEELSPEDLLNRAWFNKPQEFSAEAEWRLIIVFPAGFKITNDQLELSLGDCGDIFRLDGWQEALSEELPLDDLRNTHELFQPDIRSANMNMINGMTLETLHDWMSQCALKGSADSKVKDIFDIARNLFLYSWFQYRFTMVAAQQAVGAVELALRERCKMESVPIQTKSGKEKTLRPLLSDAIDRGWITDDGFDIRLPSTYSNAQTEQEPYTELVRRLLPTIRNWLAHGTTSFTDQGQMLQVVGSCGSIIDQLFPPTEEK